MTVIKIKEYRLKCRNHMCKYTKTKGKQTVMGMAASQARFLGLTARKTNVEYEGQQINQQRTALSNQSANYYNDLLGMSVPVPPSVDSYTQTVYTFEDGALTNEITAMIAQTDGTYTVSYLSKWQDDYVPVAASTSVINVQGGQYYVGSVALRVLGTEDPSVENDTERAAKQAEEVFGKVDVLVNNAGSAKNNGVLNMTDEEWQFTMDTDLSSVFYVTRAFGNIMKKHKYGRIINIASMYGLVGNTAMDTVAYHSSKGGVVNFTRAVAAELAKYNITCNAICPGYFATELTIDTLKTKEFTAYMKATVPVGRYGNEGELNAGAIFLASDEASYVTGVILPIDGGYTAV